MSHAARPLHIGRAFAAVAVQPAQADWPYYPTRESDGEAHVGTMLDLRQLRISHPRAMAREFLSKARAARLDGDSAAWSWFMRSAAAWRRQYAEVRHG